jgi:hypothetical protein
MIRTPNCGSDECKGIQEVVDRLRDTIKEREHAIEGLRSRVEANRKQINHQARLLKITKRCAICRHFQFIGVQSRLPHCNFRNIGVDILDTCYEFGVNKYLLDQYENNHCLGDYVQHIPSKPLKRGEEDQ